MHLALALDIDCATHFQHERRAQSLLRGFRHMDSTRQAVGFHPDGRVDHVSPQVIEKLALADNAGRDRAGDDTDARSACDGCAY